MKKTHVCPKCAGRKVWVIERFRVPSDTHGGRILPALVDQPSATKSTFSFARENPKGHFDLYLCDGCGYSELWAEAIRDLVPDPANGVRLLDTSDRSEGPFR